MTTILEDALCKPDLFCWFGAVSAAEIQDWVMRFGLSLPEDLLEFWRITGGGDLFESETILRPNVPSCPSAGFAVGDDTETANNAYRESGMAEHLFVFQTGTFLSAIDLRTKRYVTLSERHAVKTECASFEDWYLQSLRAEFGPRYGLSLR